MALVRDHLTKTGFAAVAGLVLSGACSSGDDAPFGWHIQSSGGTSGLSGTGGDSPEGGGSNSAGEGSGGSATDAGAPGSGGDGAAAAQGGTGGSGARGGTGGSGARGGTGAHGGISGQGGSAGSSAAGGEAGEPNMPNLGVAKLERIVTDAPWVVGQQTTGIAVDHDGRVYVSDPDAVYRVTGTTVEPFLSAEEIENLTEIPIPHIDDIDISPDDLLDVMASGVLVSTSTPHGLELRVDMRTYTDFFEASHIGVVTGGYMVVAKNDGLWRFAGGEPETVYTEEQLGWSSGCAREDLAVAHTGTFLYQPGCSGSPLMRGDVTGGGVEVLYQPVAIQDNPLEAQTFLCVARDPAGGFYAVVDNDLDHVELYHLDEGASDGTGVRRIEIEPTLQSERNTQESPFAMSFCSIAVDPDTGSISLVTFADLWRISWD